MSLSDLMGHAGLAWYAEVALVIFLVVFAAVVARTFAPGRRADHDRAAQLPLHDDGPNPPQTGASDGPVSR